MRIKLLIVSFFVFILNAFSANLIPWKVTVLNGFPEVAKSINLQTKEALVLLEGKKSPEVLKKQLTQKIAAVEASVAEAKGQLAANHLSEDLFSEVDLDIAELKRNVSLKNFKAATAILRTYESALDTFVFVK